MDEVAPYLDAPKLSPSEHEVYLTPTVGSAVGKLYEHCRKSLEFGARFGERALPLIGSGDWNDGMNLVGVAGKGESVWTAWFQIACFDLMIPLAERRGESRMRHAGKLGARHSATPSKPKPGTALGINGRMPTTAPYSARTSLPNARSTHWPNHGRFCVVQRTPTVQHRRCNRSGKS